MSQRTPKSMTDSLRQQILDSPLSYRKLGQETGVDRLTITRFAQGEQSIILESADTLAAYFGLEVVQQAKRKGQ